MPSLASEHLWQLTQESQVSSVLSSDPLPRHSSPPEASVLGAQGLLWVPVPVSCSPRPQWPCAHAQVLSPAQARLLRPHPCPVQLLNVPWPSQCPHLSTSHSSPCPVVYLPHLDFCISGRAQRGVFGDRLLVLSVMVSPFIHVVRVSGLPVRG